MVGGSTHERFWQVQAVFGCERHPGPGFAYTMGLAERGLHELHIWDQPTHGDDPGADFILSSADMCHILNGFADEWVAGTLHVGDVRELSLDDGLTAAVVTFGQPVDADEVDAWGARPAMVVPLSWRLHRPPRGEPVEILDDAREEYERDIRAAGSMCDSRVAVSGVSLPPDEIRFDVDAAYGPLSALVEAHALAIAGTPKIELLVDQALAAEAAMSPMALIGRMSTMSRLSGRDQQVREVERLAGRVMDRLVLRWAWRSHVVDVAQQCEMPLSKARRNMTDLVTTLVRCTLMGLALDDVLPDDMVLGSQGPWRATLSSSGADPGPKWRCSVEAERAVRGCLATLDLPALLDLAAFVQGPVTELLGTDVLIVRGRAVTRNLAPPSVLELVPPSCRQTASIPGVLTELSLFAQLLVAIVDESLPCSDERLEALHALLRLHGAHSRFSAEWAAQIELVLR